MHHTSHFIHCPDAATPFARLCPDSTTASVEKRHGRRDGSAHRAGRLGRRVMAMTIRAEVRRSVRRGDEERRPRVAVALGLLESANLVEAAREGATLRCSSAGAGSACRRASRGQSRRREGALMA
jgi:hypothetical protein